MIPAVGSDMQALRIAQVRLGNLYALSSPVIKTFSSEINELLVHMIPFLACG
jgi:hypothetical protein